MKPEAVKEHLRAKHGASSDQDQAREHASSDRESGGAGQPPAMTAKPKASVPLLPSTREEAVFANISASYFLLRRSLAALAFALPLVLMVGAGLDHIQGSISAYYHFSSDDSAYGAGTMRNVFVGTLWAAGTFLVAYKGYSTRENIALNIAGVAAVLVSLWPMDWPATANSASPIATIHYLSAVTLFLAIAYVCIFCSNDTLAIMRNKATKRRFQGLYKLLGTLMVMVPAAIFVVYKIAEVGDGLMILLVEIAGIWVFAAFWLAKSREISILEKQ